MSTYNETRHISLDREDERVKRFVRSLPVDSAGSILELDGHPLLRVSPVSHAPVDTAELTAAILKRRDTSRTLNRDWDAADHELWEKLPDTEG